MGQAAEQSDPGTETLRRLAPCIHMGETGEGPRYPRAGLELAHAQRGEVTARADWNALPKSYTDLLAGSGGWSRQSTTSEQSHG